MVGTKMGNSGDYWISNSIYLSDPCNHWCSDAQLSFDIQKICSSQCEFVWKWGSPKRWCLIDMLTTKVVRTEVSPVSLHAQKKQTSICFWYSDGISTMWSLSPITTLNSTLNILEEKYPHCILPIFVAQIPIVESVESRVLNTHYIPRFASKVTVSDD